MARFDDYCYSSWIKNLVKSKSHLFGESLLDLESAREHIGNSCEFGEPDDPLSRNISDVHLSLSAMTAYARCLFIPFL